MTSSTRRDFLKSGVAATVLSGVGGVALAQTAKRSATDWVTLGKSKVKVTRLAFGTGTHGGQVQRQLGQEEFTKLVRYAYDRGIRFFETSDTYRGMPEMLGIALKGLPRDTYRLMTKYHTPSSGDPTPNIDEARRQLQTEYIDILLLHCLRPPTWEADYRSLQDGFSEAKSKKVILSHGASVHGLPALRTFPGNQWLDIAMIRMNHNGTKMDSEDARDQVPGSVDEVVAHTKKVHAQGMGVISMKLCGEGRFTRAEDRDAAMKFAMNLGCVDAVTIGFKTTAEIDEAIERVGRVMNA
ncbi:MAG TPA: aldo/keto reductase [Bryobacteraceae bacterium]|jgi:aryl-alcohol dehydrogenase-like predicted oxidoreductase|nr:aldo/keto reductase [Bryobacteraceae bacterium]